MTEEEIAVAWFRATRELDNIKLEIAGLESEIKRIGVRLSAHGKLLLETPCEAWNYPVESLSDDLLKSWEMAKRYTDLLGQRADKETEVERFVRR